MALEAIHPNIEILPSANVPDRAVGGGKRNDVQVMADTIEADIFNPENQKHKSTLLDKLGRKVRINFSQASDALRGKPDVILSTSEISGIGVEAMRQFHRWEGKHVVISHKLDSGLKSKVQKYWQWFNHVDALICLSQTQYEYAKDSLHVPEEKLHLVNVGIDTNWYAPPTEKIEPEQKYGLAVGKEQRDYPTLIEAMRIVQQTRPDISIKVVAGSHWSTYKDTSAVALPQNITFETRFLTEEELLNLYQQAHISVVPINPDQTYAAGVNGMLEATSTGNRVVVSKTPGMSGYIDQLRDAEENNDSGIHTVAPGDAEALARTIIEAWDRPVVVQNRLVQATRENFSLESYTQKIAEIVDTLKKK